MVDPVSKEARGAKIRRRLKTVPAIVVAAVVMTALVLPLLVLAVLVDLARLAFSRQKGIFVRLVLMTWFWLVIDVLGLVALAVTWFAAGFGSNRQRLQSSAFAIQQWWAARMYAALRLLFRIDVEVDGADHAASGPYVLLVRHASIVDNILPSALIGGPFRMQLRYVMKRDLLMDPCFDIAGQRLPNHFVRRDSGDPAELEAVRDLAREMGASDGALIYPEGTRVDDERRTKAIERIAKRDPARADRLSGLKHTMPPRLGGPLALLEEAAGDDVVVLSHAGFDGLRELGDVLQGGLVGRRVRVRIERFNRAALPESEGLATWLDDKWIEIDGWIDGQLKQLSEGS